MASLERLFWTVGAAGTMSARRHYSLTLSHSVTNVPRYYVPSTVSDSRWPIRHAVRFPSGAVSKGTGLGSLQSLISKIDRDLTPDLDVPIWSQITTSSYIKNRHVKYGMRATLGQIARRAPCTIIKIGLLHNTTRETTFMRSGWDETSPSEEELRVWERWCPPREYK